MHIEEVETYDFTSREAFQDHIGDHRRPLLIRNCPLGPCTEKWTVDYLARTLGANQVKVHVSPVGAMSFIEKNFTYKTLSFAEFIQRANSETHTDWFLCENESYYLRSIGTSVRRGREVADVNKQFPQIAQDITLPDLFDPKDFFSSVFRIGSKGVRIWTHYDVMDNALMQLTGEKKVTLFSPSDTHLLYLSGDKSRVLDIDSPDPAFPDFMKAVRFECVLRSGDVLFIPALWHHNTVSLTFGVGVNVFWKNLPHELYDPTDVYGNKDLLPAAKALKDVSKAIQSLSVLPPVYRNFYIQRAITALEEAKT